MARSSTSATSTGSSRNSILPASIFSRSRTSLTSAVRRSPSAAMISRFSPTWRTARSSFGSASAPSRAATRAGRTTSSIRFRTIFVKPTIEVSGVRSSWLTFARNWLLVALAASAVARAACASWVTSASCAVRVATRASSSRFASSTWAYRRALSTASARRLPTVNSNGPIERSTSRPERRLSTASTPTVRPFVCSGVPRNELTSNARANARLGS